MRKRLILAAVGTALLVSSLRAWSVDGSPVRSDQAVFNITTLTAGLEHPWGAAFLPDGRLLVTERPGRMRVVDQDGRVSAPLGGVPPVERGGWEGGLLDVAVAPDFGTTREIYFCHTARVQTGALTRLARARLSPDAKALEGATRSWM
jgi:glucose/arabinose dehydrogenase